MIISWIHKQQKPCKPQKSPILPSEKQTKHDRSMSQSSPKTSSPAKKSWYPINTLAKMLSGTPMIPICLPWHHQGRECASAPPHRGRFWKQIHSLLCNAKLVIIISLNYKFCHIFSIKHSKPSSISNNSEISSHQAKIIKNHQFGRIEKKSWKKAW